MDCRDAEPLLHARLDNELDVGGATSVDRHLSECAACAAQYAAPELQNEMADSPGIRASPRLEVKLATRFTSQNTGLAQFWRSLGCVPRLWLEQPLASRLFSIF